MLNAKRERDEHKTTRLHVPGDLMVTASTDKYTTAILHTSPSNRKIGPSQSSNNSKTPPITYISNHEKTMIPQRSESLVASPESDASSSTPISFSSLNNHQSSPNNANCSSSSFTHSNNLPPKSVNYSSLSNAPPRIEVSPPQTSQSRDIGNIDASQKSALSYPFRERENHYGYHHNYPQDVCNEFDSKNDNNVDNRADNNQFLQSQSHTHHQTLTSLPSDLGLTNNPILYQNLTPRTIEKVENINSNFRTLTKMMEQKCEPSPSHLVRNSNPAYTFSECQVQGGHPTYGFSEQVDSNHLKHMTTYPPCNVHSIAKPLQSNHSAQISFKHDTISQDPKNYRHQNHDLQAGDLIHQHSPFKRRRSIQELEQNNDFENKSKRKRKDSFESLTIAIPAGNEGRTGPPVMFCDNDMSTQRIMPLNGSNWKENNKIGRQGSSPVQHSPTDSYLHSAEGRTQIDQQPSLSQQTLSRSPRLEHSPERDIFHSGSLEKIPREQTISLESNAREEFNASNSTPTALSKLFTLPEYFSSGASTSSSQIMTPLSLGTPRMSPGGSWKIASPRELLAQIEKEALENESPTFQP